MIQPIPSSTLSREEKADVLVYLRESIDRLELQFSQLAAEFAEERYWDSQGSNSALDWIRFNCHMTSNAAADRLAVGKRAPELHRTVAAMDEGEIGFAHLAVITRTADALGDAFTETAVLEMAKENSPGKFHYQCLHYRHAVNALAYAKEQNQQTEGSYLHLNTQEDGGMFLVGQLDSVGGAALRSALEPLARSSGEHDDRLLPQRYADALVELACGGRPANLQVTATIETLKGLAGAQGGEMEFSLPLASASVQRLACDCSVTRVLLSQESLTIDVGRSKRILGSGLRKALRVRDQFCRWPGCERPASWCDGHHLVHWIHGGETNLDNLVLLCRRHHRMVHEGDWQLIKTSEGQIITIAPTITFGLPRGPD